MTFSADPGTDTSTDAFVLYCPHCEYNLTGLPEDRCPECGQAFNRKELEADARGRTIIPQEMQKGIVNVEAVSAFLSMIGQSMFHPIAAARSLPRLFPQQDPITLSLCSRSYSTLLLFGFLAIQVMLNWTGPVAFPLLPVFILAIHAWGTSLLAECVAAGLLNGIVPQHPPGRRKVPETSSSWFGLVALHSGFQFVICAFNAFFLFIAAVVTMNRESPGPDAAIFAVGGSMGVALWWWINLCIGVYVRSRSKVRATVAIVLLANMLFLLALVQLVVCTL